MIMSGRLPFCDCVPVPPGSYGPLLYFCCMHYYNVFKNTVKGSLVAKNILSCNVLSLAIALANSHPTMDHDNIHVQILIVIFY